jgi:hypothetical protein
MRSGVARALSLHTCYSARGRLGVGGVLQYVLLLLYVPCCTCPLYVLGSDVRASAHGPWVGMLLALFLAVSAFDKDSGTPADGATFSCKNLPCLGRMGVGPKTFVVAVAGCNRIPTPKDVGGPSGSRLLRPAAGTRHGAQRGTDARAPVRRLRTRPHPRHDSSGAAPGAVG